MSNQILDSLNEKQREACQIKSGPILIIAGAGSGKTRTLTHRVTFLIQEGENPGGILAVTFTNKAANEMKEKIQTLLRVNSKDRKIVPRALQATSYKLQANILTIGTFHSVCVKILRQEAGLLGYKKNFAIYDEYDQTSLIKDVMKKQDLNLEKINPKTILAMISSAKNELIGFEEYKNYAHDSLGKIAAKVYEHYQNSLKSHNALDFDDLIMLACELFKKYPKILAKYQERFEHILVDEYQDTNRAQYELVNLLARKKRNICVVGDDWQGIYGWRGANIQNILNFEKDYPEAKVVKLEQNYRSTQNILDVSHNVITKSINQKEKRLWTENDRGEKITIFEASDEKDEAEFIIREINERKDLSPLVIASDRRERSNPTLQSNSTGLLRPAVGGTRNDAGSQSFYNNFVILYRTHAQSRVLEEEFMNYGIPYRIIGGIRFYERAEIKDIISFLKIIQNQDDVLNIKRIINIPPKNIGAKTFYSLERFAKENNLDLISAASRAKKISEITFFSQKSLIQFADTIQSLIEKSKKIKLTKLIDFILEKGGYKNYILDGSDEGQIRFENIQELKSVAKKFDVGAIHELPLRLQEFLEEVALFSSADELDKKYAGDKKNDAVTLMTVHSAKGLEYDTVFICGLEENIFPHSRSMLEPQDLEEERRLCYVGMTRAKRKLYLVYARERNLFGHTQVNLPSRFIEDVSEKYVQKDRSYF
jgi:DNA helicase-2/ATP-dependent DNA helicase PcrA